ncbi:hypothetical protein OIV19_18235 [Brucella sp. HL-2]|nr:hypothetical protein [Brucella sp. HL-2]MCV9909542.1 hypothetical protein [Brucella sp. HL-2]
MTLINSFADQYCDVAGMDADDQKRAVSYSHIGAQLTLIKVEGVTSILSTAEVEKNLSLLFGEAGVASLFRAPGHSMSISFERHFNTSEDISSIIGELNENAQRKDLEVGAITEEYSDILSKNLVNEVILLACWTMPNAAFPDEVKQERDAKNKSEAKFFSHARSAMSPYLRLDALRSPHDAFVSHVLDALSAAAIKAHVLGPNEHGDRPDLAEIKRGIFFHETPKNWRPVSTGERKYPGKLTPTDYSEAFAPPLSRQILPTSASSSKNFREISIGSRTFTSMYFNMFPRDVRPFNELLASLKSRDTATMPFRVTFHWEATDFKIAMKRILAGLFRWAAPVNANYFDNIRVMEEMQNRDEVTFVDARVCACTWVEPHEDRETVLSQRRSLLTRALARWGDPIVADIPSNPMRALAETVSGMTTRSVLKNASKIPAPTYAAMMPFHRTAPIFDRGESLFLSMENTLVPHEVFSSKQNYWLSGVVATPGSGKSVLMNRLNLDMIAYAGGAALPYLCVIDVGVSSSGLIGLIKAGLPQEREHEASYTLLRNHREYAINPFDLGLGRRIPLARERDFIKLFLCELLMAEETSTLITYLVQRVFAITSDMGAAGAPKLFQAKVDSVVDAGLQALHDRGVALKISPKTPWYSVADILAEHSMFTHAIRAQRYAVPVLSDIVKVLSEPQTVNDFGTDAVREAQNSVMAAIESYPLFASHTALDLDVARVISIDLQEVIQRDRSANARRNNTLMYMLARQLFVSKIAGNTRELNAVSECMPRHVQSVYLEYWRKQYSSMQEVFKRLCMDEYHLTNGSTNIRSMIMADAREGRKWGLEIILVSQLVSDFEQINDMASTIFILNAENAQARKEMQETFGFSSAVMDEMTRYLHGPGERGANFLARYKLSDREHWITLNNRLGPTTLWALTTKKEDRLIRDALYENLPVKQALRFLGALYPHGTAVSLYRQFERKFSSSHESGVVTEIAQHLMGEYARYIAEQETRRNNKVQ